MSLIKSALQHYVNARRLRYYARTRRSMQARTVGASEIGLCMRRIWYAKQNLHITIDTKHSDTMNWGAAQRGVNFERHFWVPAMRRAYGENFLFSGGSQVSMKYNLLRATPDGLLIKQPRNALAHLGVPDIGPTRSIVTECKTIDPRIPLQEAKHEHVFQAHVQLGMFHRCTNYRPHYAVISYVNASFYDDITEFVVKYDHSIFAHAEWRASKILMADEAKELPPEGWLGGAKECEWCPFKKPCDAIRLPAEEVSEAPPINPQVLSELTSIGRNERSIATRVSELQAEQRNLQELIKSRLRDLGLRRIESDGIKIIWSPVKGRPSYDMPGLRAAAAALGLDIQKFETVGDATDRLIVTLLPSGPQGKQEDPVNVTEKTHG